MSQQLYLFQIGPVQSFIAAARRTQDLFVGSRLLSMIAAAGAQAALDSGATLIFPAVGTSTNPRGGLPTSVPHRFAFLSDREGVAETVEKRLHTCWRDDITGRVRDWLQRRLAGDQSWTTVFNRQVKDWLEVYWVAVPYDPATHSACYKRAGQVMAARKAARHFSQVKENGEKCTLSGAQQALPIDWKALRTVIGDTDERILRPNERLGALALTKRLAQEAGVNLGIDEQRIRRFPSMNDIAGVDENDTETPAYLAILHMDGDRMGARLGSVDLDEEAHRALSERLAQFAEQHVPNIIREQGGKGTLIYAGGDDVLALLPLKNVLACAEALRVEFAKHIGGTMSAGVAIMAANTPFDSALEEARLAEKRAKSVYERNAIVVRDIRSSAIREAGANWTYANGTGNEKLIGLFTRLQGYFANNQLSGKLGYDLLNLAHQMGGNVPPEARRAEVGRLIKRRTAEGAKALTAQEQTELADALCQIAESPYRWESVANWVILVRFLANGGHHD